jgi:hypothetical protein
MSSAARPASAFAPLPISSATRVSSSSATVPWYIWIGAIAVTSSSIGGAWDVSWHRSIGRDTFWTPAHMLIYACGVLAGIVGAWLVLNATFGRDEQLRNASLEILGLRAPLGVFLAGWGGVASSPQRLSTIGGTTPMALTSKSSVRPTRC